MIVVKSEKLPAIFLSTTDKSVSYKLNVYDNNNRQRRWEGGGREVFWPAAYFDPK